MTIENLLIENFRSHKRRSLTFGPVTAIIGPNGVGKTNILEALWVLATTRSFRTHHDGELIRWDELGAKLTAGIFEIRFAREPVVRKSLTINGVTRKPIDYLGELRAVLFTPDSLAIITGSPIARRRFLDTILAQRDRQAAYALARYRHVVAQRNALLRLISAGRGSAGELAPWDQQLIELGAYITGVREELVRALADPLCWHYLSISGRSDDDVRMTYQATGSSEAAEFEKRLHAHRSRELRFGVTLVGPHRDDVMIELRNHPLADHGSRGELRSVILALKWAECELMTTKEQTPLLLLDDVFSELDSFHRQALEELVLTTQTMCTTTEVENIPTGIQSAATIIEL